MPPIFGDHEVNSHRYGVGFGEGAVKSPNPSFGVIGVLVNCTYVCKVNGFLDNSTHHIVSLP